MGLWGWGDYDDGTAAEAQGSDVDGKPTCCVCMEPWTCDDAHRICCIPCGHVYGRSCLENWLHRSGNTSAKCPRCGKRFSLEHIINLYAPRNLWGGCFRTQASVTSGINVFKTELNKQILDMLGEPASIERQHGVHIDEIIDRFKLPKKKILDIIYRNEDVGNIYTTIDDFHYKLACIDIYIQAPVTSGASGPEAELNNQVLNILREPASIEQENGVHIDEIMKRFKLPKRKIMESGLLFFLIQSASFAWFVSKKRVAIEYDIDIGNAYWTIDEFHVMSALDD